MDKILTPNPNRFTLFPIQHPDLWKFYKIAFNTFWGPGELKLDLDKRDWENKLTETEKEYIKYILAFFANADGIVNENLVERFQKDVNYIEANYFYSYQSMIENVHAEVYGILIDTYIKDEVEKTKLFNAIETIPCIKKKSNWALKWITSSTASFGERLLAFAAIEGIFFSGAFAGIYWLRKRNLLPGLAQVNTLIARDEGLHQHFACHLYKHHLHHQKVSSSRAKEIIMEACELEKEFQTEALPVSMIGMNNNQMKKYIEYVSDYLMVMIGEAKIYNSENPFDFMELISLETLESMFEVRGVNYTHANITKSELKLNDIDDEIF